MMTENDESRRGVAVYNRLEGRVFNLNTLYSD